MIRISTVPTIIVISLVSDNPSSSVSLTSTGSGVGSSQVSSSGSHTGCVFAGLFDLGSTTYSVLRGNASVLLQRQDSSNEAIVIYFDSLPTYSNLSIIFK